jgi:hypothetical protein
MEELSIHLCAAFVSSDGRSIFPSPCLSSSDDTKAVALSAKTWRAPRTLIEGGLSQSTPVGHVTKSISRVTSAEGHPAGSVLEQSGKKQRCLTLATSEDSNCVFCNPPRLTSCVPPKFPPLGRRPATSAQRNSSVPKSAPAEERTACNWSRAQKNLGNGTTAPMRQEFGGYHHQITQLLVNS